MKDTKTFATPSKPVSTPGRRALRERNETFVSGSNYKKDSIASVTENIFDNADVASSTLKSEQIVSIFSVLTSFFINANFSR